MPLLAVLAASGNADVRDGRMAALGSGTVARRQVAQARETSRVAAFEYVVQLVAVGRGDVDAWHGEDWGDGVKRGMGWGGMGWDGMG